MIRHCDKFFSFDAKIAVETAEAINVLRKKFIEYAELVGFDELATILHEEACDIHEREFLFPEVLSHQLPYGCSDLECSVDLFSRISNNPNIPRLYEIVAELRQLRISYLYHRQDLVDSLANRASCNDIVSYQYDMVTTSSIEHHERYLVTVGALVRDLRDPMKIEYKFEKDCYEIMKEDTSKQELFVKGIMLSLASTPFYHELLI